MPPPLLLLDGEANEVDEDRGEVAVALAFAAPAALTAVPVTLDRGSNSEAKWRNIVWKNAGRLAGSCRGGSAAAEVAPPGEDVEEAAVACFGAAAFLPPLPPSK
jgi:hypothetical protein